MTPRENYLTRIFWQKQQDYVKLKGSKRKHNARVKTTCEKARGTYGGRYQALKIKMRSKLVDKLKIPNL
tara:strand:+ start:182 stop:388 length:207 start_codon:yes stop_codon:yes gene_type:complete